MQPEAVAITASSRRVHQNINIKNFNIKCKVVKDCC